MSPGKVMLTDVVRPASTGLAMNRALEFTFSGSSVSASLNIHGWPKRKIHIVVIQPSFFHFISPTPLSATLYPLSPTPTATTTVYAIPRQKVCFNNCFKSHKKIWQINPELFKWRQNMIWTSTWYLPTNVAITRPVCGCKSTYGRGSPRKSIHSGRTTRGLQFWNTADTARWLLRDRTSADRSAAPWGIVAANCWRSKHGRLTYFRSALCQLF